MDSPTAAYQTLVSQYASVGALAVLTWDILDNIPGDYRIPFVKQRNKLSVPTVAYILSRIGAFAYALLSIIFDTAPIGHCTLLNTIALSWCSISFGATAFLFFWRIRAVYNRDRFVVFIFFVLWLAVVVGGALVPVGTKGGPLIGPGNIATGYCAVISVSALSSYGITAPLVFDTLVLLAISWRLSTISTMNDPGVNVGKSVKAMLFGADLPTFARSLLINGQIYYLITVITGVACVVLLYSPIVPGPLSVLLEDVYPVVVNIMACRLFRSTKSGAIREPDISPSVARTVSQRTHLPPMKFAVSLSSAESGSEEVVHGV